MRWLLAVFILAALPGLALADAAPLTPVGPNFQPIGQTQVRMENEKMTAGFPLHASVQKENFYATRVQGFQVKVGGQPVPHEERRADYYGEPRDWAVWQLDFKKGQPLDLEVRYHFDVYGRGKGGDGDLYLTYILDTGAYWAGTIGKADAVVTFDRPVRKEVSGDRTPAQGGCGRSALSAPRLLRRGGAELLG